MIFEGMKWESRIPQIQEREREEKKKKKLCYNYWFFARNRRSIIKQNKKKEAGSRVAPVHFLTYLLPSSKKSGSQKKWDVGEILKHFFSLAYAGGFN